MKRFLKAFGVILCVFTVLLTLTSCSGYDFYEDWHNAGATIEKENIYQLITLDEAKQKIDNKDTFVLIYASSSNSESVKVISSFQAQAEYLQRTDAVIYYLNSSEFTSTSDRTKVRETIKMHEAPSDGSPIVMGYKNSAAVIDTSDKNRGSMKDYFKGDQVQYASLASYIFKDLLKK